MPRIIYILVLRTITSFLLVFTVLCSFSAFAGEPWKFIVAGDSRSAATDLLKTNGVNSEVLGPLAEQIAKSGADFVLIPGDLMIGTLQHSFTKKYLEQWLTTMAPVYKAGIKVYPVAGNHEWTDSGLPEIWRQVFPDLPGNGPAGEEKMTYSFTHKNALLIGLDEYFEHRHEVNQKWLDKQLAGRDARAQPHVFTFGHEPAYAVHHADCLDSDEEARDAFVQSLANVGSRLYFCGHDHFYNHAEIRGFFAKTKPVIFHQLVVGTAGAPIYHWKGEYSGKNGKGKTVTKIYHDENPGSYCQVEVDDFTVTIKYVQRQDDGKYSVAESFSYTLPQQ